MEEICAVHRSDSANVEVQPGYLGTAPTQVVLYAKQLFEQGNSNKCLCSRSFDQVYAVFDSDAHGSYFNALNYAQSLDDKLRNYDKQSALKLLPLFLASRCDYCCISRLFKHRFSAIR